MNMRSGWTVPVNATDLRWRLTIGIITPLLWFTACSERSQELDERVTQLQKELDQTETQLQAANRSLKTAREELARLKGNSGSSRETPSEIPSVTTSASREVLEKSYTEKGKLLKQQLQEKLQTFTIGTCTLHNINVASPEYPVTSTISLSIRSNTGNSFQLDLPARADRAGRWSFPDLTEIVQRIEEIGKSSAGSSSGSGETSSGSRVTSSTQQPETRGATGMPADRTAVIRWPESGRTSVQPNVASAPPPAAGGSQPAPQSQPAEAKGPSANRTFVIQWQDGGKPAPETRNSAPTAPSPSSGSKQKKPDQDVLTQF
jgi:hypothetical protein